MKLLAIDKTRSVFFSFNTETQSVVETFMIRLGYNNTDYYLETDNNNIVAKLIKEGYTETEIMIWCTKDTNDDNVYIYMII